MCALYCAGALNGRGERRRASDAAHACDRECARASQLALTHILRHGQANVQTNCHVARNGLAAREPLHWQATQPEEAAPAHELVPYARQA